jgi:hypothetical protein
MLVDDQQRAERRLAWSQAAATAARRRSAGTTVVAGLGFHAAIRCESAELARAVAVTFADLTASTESERADATTHSHDITVVAARGGCVAVWADGVQVAARLRPGIALPTISWLVNQGVIAHASDLLLFHAAALCSGDAGLLLPATSGSGKSTLAAALVASGLSYLSDEVGALDLQSGRLVAYPKPISLDDASFVALGTTPAPVERSAVVDDATAHWTDLQWQVPATAVRGSSVASTCPTSFVVFPTRSAGRPAGLRPLGRAALCARLVEHSMTVARRPREHFSACAALATRIRGFELDLDGLADACSQLSNLLGASSGPTTVPRVMTR